MSVLAGLGISILGLAANVISVAIPYWMYYERKLQSVVLSGHRGLWKICGNTLGTSVCSNISDPADWLNAVRALMIIGAVCLAIGIAVAFYGVRSKQTVKSAGFVVALGGVCCIVAAIIYGAEIPHDSVKHLHAGFGLAVTAGIVSIVGGVFLVKANIGSPGYSSI